MKPVSVLSRQCVSSSSLGLEQSWEKNNNSQSTPALYLQSVTTHVLKIHIEAFAWNVHVLILFVLHIFLPHKNTQMHRHVSQSYTTTSDPVWMRNKRQNDQKKPKNNKSTKKLTYKIHQLGNYKLWVYFDEIRFSFIHIIIHNV